MSGCAVTKPAEPNATSIKMNLAADESVRPRWVDEEAMLEQLDAARVAGTPEKDDVAVQRSLQTEGEPVRDGTSFWAGFPPRAERRPTCLHVPQRSRLERGKRIMMKSASHLGLPAPVEILESILEAELTRQGEGGHQLRCRHTPLTTRA